jgi:hypothetical protein
MLFGRTTAEQDENNRAEVSHDCRIPNNGRGACRNCGTTVDGVGMSEV